MADRYVVQGIGTIREYVALLRRIARLADEQSFVKELFSLLASHKVLPLPLSKRLISMAGFRNVLVHECLEIDRHRVYRALKADPADFERFIKAISKVL